MRAVDLGPKVLCEPTVRNDCLVPLLNEDAGHVETLISRFGPIRSHDLGWGSGIGMPVMKLFVTVVPIVIETRTPPAATWEASRYRFSTVTN